MGGSGIGTIIKYGFIYGKLNGVLILVNFQCSCNLFSIYEKYQKATFDCDDGMTNSYQYIDCIVSMNC